LTQLIRNNLLPMEAHAKPDPPAAQLERRLYAEIPLTRHIGVRVGAYDRATLTLKAPLAANSNHKGTAFGGSLFSLAVLAGWGLLVLKLAARGLEAEIVIQDSEVDYVAPVHGDFSARATLPDGDEFDRFVRTLERRGRARVQVSVVVSHDGREAVRFKGNFAAVRPQEPSRVAIG
jgi:thioesterase domain-containing protein